MLTIDRWPPGSPCSLRSDSAGRGGRGLGAGPVCQLPVGWVLVEEKVVLNKAYLLLFDG